MKRTTETETVTATTDDGVTTEKIKRITTTIEDMPYSLALGPDPDDPMKSVYGYRCHMCPRYPEDYTATEARWPSIEEAMGAGALHVLCLHAEFPEME